MRDEASDVNMQYGETGMCKGWHGLSEEEFKRFESIKHKIK